jgi:hypothetical protein
VLKKRKNQLRLRYQSKSAVLPAMPQREGFDLIFKRVFCVPVALGPACDLNTLHQSFSHFSNLLFRVGFNPILAKCSDPSGGTLMSRLSTLEYSNTYVFPRSNILSR